MERLYNKNCDYKSLNPLSLAFIGDAVFELFVRDQIICQNRCAVNKLHKRSVEKVCCQSQAEYVEQLFPHLTDEEKDAFRKGKNSHTKNIPKNATLVQYHNATGLETLFGYLYLKGKIERLRELFNIISPSTNNN